MVIPGNELYFFLCKLCNFPPLKSFLESVSIAQTGLKGEDMNLVSPSGISSVDWVKGSLAALKQQPLTWYKVWVVV